MKNFLFCRTAVLTLLCLVFSAIQAQEEPDVNAFTEVDKEAQPENMYDVQRAIGYPKIARDAGIEGNVVVRVLVDTAGKYVRHVVLNEVHPVLSNAVVVHLPKLTFTPAQKEGESVFFWVNIPFAFKLLGGKEGIPEGIKIVEEKDAPGNALLGDLSQGEFSLSPNPGTGELSLSFQHSEPVAIRKVLIINLEGKLLYEYNLKYQGKFWEHTVQLDELPNATYLIQLHSPDNVLIQRWVKN